MRTAFSPELLSAYIGAAAGQVLAKRELTARSLWAIAQARAQLGLELDEISSPEPAVVGAARAALVGRPEGDHETLGDLLVQSPSEQSVKEALDELELLEQADVEAATSIRARLLVST